VTGMTALYQFLLFLSAYNPYIYIDISY